MIIALADHFEPSIIPNAPEGIYAEPREQERRLAHWCREYPKLVDLWRDADGFPFRHTYFYPAEQYTEHLVARLAEHCHAGWGEIEIQLHHGTQAPDTPERTREVLAEFRQILVGHGCLSRWKGQGSARYAFVHGNWALANSANGQACGVDNEMKILAETGCYADFTLPSAPNPAQVSKINAIYECALPLSQRAPHRRGRDVTRNRPVATFPLIVQGPLLLRFDRSGGSRLLPRIENSELAAPNPPTLQRLHLWRQANITVQGRSEWIFVKLHCHGMDPRDEVVMLGEPMQKFLENLKELVVGGTALRFHFTTAREMVNIILAACDGHDGNPGDYRDYRLRPIATRS
jgi:hypothetical protein